MSFTLPYAPSPRAGISEVADFAELIAWQRGDVSDRELVRTLNQLDDNTDNAPGCDDEEDANMGRVQEVFAELDRRQKHCRESYPYEVTHKGSRLIHAPISLLKPSQIIYRYLLLGTRLNMTTEKIQASLDGTTLFEELSAEVLKQFLGTKRARHIVFGTATRGSFAGKVADFCRILAEGHTYCAIDASGSFANDGKFDAIAWVPFNDRRAGKLMIVVQCKTGTSWRDQVTQCQPDTFARKFMNPNFFFVTPVRAFFVAESIDSETWKSVTLDAGLVFDRGRVVEFTDDVEPSLVTKIHAWTTAAHLRAKVFSDANGALISRRPSDRRRRIARTSPSSVPHSARRSPSK